MLIEGVIGGSGANGLTLNGPGELVLAGVNTYTGATLVNAGTVTILEASALGATGASDGTAVAAGAVLRIDDDAGLAIGMERLTLSGQGSGGTGALLSAGGVNSWAGPVTLAADATIGVSVDSLTVSGAIGQSGGARSLTKAGTGGLTLTGVNTFTGGAIVNKGTLTLGTGAGLASVSLTVASQGTLSIASGAAISTSAALAVDGSLDFNGATVSVASLTGAASGVVTLNGTALTLGAGSFAGTIEDGASVGSLVKTGAGLLALTGANTYTGGTVIGGGALGIASEAALGASGALTLAGGTLRLDAPLTLTRNLSIGAGGGKIDTNGHDIVVSGSISGSLPLQKEGDGMLVLSSANAGFTGSLEILDGLLRLTGTASVPGFIDGGGSFDGNGLVGALTVRDAGILAPGVGVGTLRAGGLSLLAGSHFQLELDGRAAGMQYDQLSITGSVSLAGHLSVSSLNGFTPNHGDKFFVLVNDGTDAITGGFNGFGQGSTVTFGGISFLLSYTGDSASGSFTGGNDVVLQAIPEPSALHALLAGVALFAGCARLQRRRRCSWPMA